MGHDQIFGDLLINLGTNPNNVALQLPLNAPVGRCWVVANFSDDEVAVPLASLPGWPAGAAAAVALAGGDADAAGGTTRLPGLAYLWLTPGALGP